MCLVPPARVIVVNGQEAAVELHGGMQATVSIALQPDVAAGQYVLVDRGLVIRVIDAAEAEAIIAMYDEIGDLLDAADEPGPMAASQDTRPVFACPGQADHD